MIKAIFSVTPAADSFVTQYSSGDVIGEANVITGAALDVGGCVELETIVVLDKANQKSAIDLVFFERAPEAAYGDDNAAYALNDSDLDKCLGRFSIAQADYVSSSTTNAEATYRNVGLLLKAYKGTRDIYVIAVSRGTPTYGSASDLILKFGFKQK